MCENSLNKPIEYEDMTFETVNPPPHISATDKGLTWMSLSNNTTENKIRSMVLEISLGFSLCGLFDKYIYSVSL